ncbi:unnamed protein product [Phyllotreta striolata]|uniref:acid phosphatase n=1 Tax=Phyllotreta striolata TaxID=444603 RepID=A0A9N9TCS0_PHYSR|nr:unnamed protein product [Phyllotreta striolata]
MSPASRLSVLAFLCVCLVDQGSCRYSSYHRPSFHGQTYTPHNSQYGRPNSGSGPNVEKADSTVILTHVVFRHGNRTAQLSEIYPRDPYYNFDYFPFGRGQLTNVGKMREYNVGRELRTRYDKFLGDDFLSRNPLAGLFPPRSDNVWNTALNWQPVPYNFLPADRDPVLIGLNCPNYVRKYDSVVRSRKWQSEFNKDKNVFAYISKNSGLNVTTYEQIYNLYFGLSTEEEWGHKLPKWTEAVWPKIVTDLAIKHYYVQTSTSQLLSLCEGYHLKKIIEDTKRVVRSASVANGPKMYLYSGHENNVAEMLILLNVFSPPHIPTYGSYLIFEVHNINNVVGIKLYYQRYVTESPVLLKIPACDEFCPLDRFEQLFEEYLPVTEDYCYQN